MNSVCQDNARLCIPCGSDAHTTGFDVPSDVKDNVVTRLGWVALLFAATLHLVHWTRISFTPLEGHLDAMRIANVGLIAGTVLGVAFCALAWSKKLPQRMMLDAGVLFQVAAAFCIALMEFRIRIFGNGPVVGVSGTALWITFFVLVVPTTSGKAALGAGASVLMGPLALLVYAAAERIPLPESGRMLSLFLPDLLAAAWSLLLARYVYGMGRALGKARRMGYYELTERLGIGGMGEVWRAKHRMLARPAAIKLISHEMLGRDGELTSTLIRRFEREAQATATLQSQHTIQLYDFGVSEDGALYYVMEYLDGLDLQTMIEKYGPIPPERAVHFLLQILDSLEEAHQAGLVHRDIKPANIFASKKGLQYDFIKVLDFGLVRIMESTPSDKTVVQQVVGTPAFMAPETVLDPGDADTRSDLYSLGAVAYWMLTGRLIHDGVARIQTLLEQVRTLPPPPSERTETEIPAALDALILRCLDPDPRKRPQSAAEMTELLSAIRVTTPWTPQRAENWWRAHRPTTAQNRPAAQLSGKAA
jgi:serine/threonine-protein kinase